MKKVFIVAGMILLAVMGFWACGESYEDNPVDPDGPLKLYANSGCKSHARPDGTRGISDKEAVEFKALGDSALSFNHVNVDFECGVKQIVPYVTIVGDTIKVDERDYYDPLDRRDCICFYDVYFEIGPLENKNYCVVFLRRMDERFRFDLTYYPSLSGTYNVKEGK